MFIITAKFSKRKLFFGLAVTAALLLPAGAATDICPANCLPYLLGPPAFSPRRRSRTAVRRTPAGA